MAQPDLDYFTRRAIAIKAETTEGTDANPSTSTNAFDLMEGQSGTEFDKIERKRDRAYFTGDPFVVANKRAYVEGMFELIPPTSPGSSSGTTGNAPCEVVLFPSGMQRTRSSTNSTTIYTPISTAIPTVTFDFYHSGTLKQVVGARGNISSLAMAIGERFKGQIRLEGIYTEVEEAAVPTDGVYTSFTTPTVASHSNSQMRYFSSDADTVPLFLWGKSLSVDFGNALQSKQYTQKRIAAITDRKASWTARIARPAKADMDVYALRDAGAEIRLDFTTDDGTNYSRLKIRGQIETINEVDIDGDYGYEISGPCIASTGGGDEFGIEFGVSSLRLIGDLPDQAAGTYSASLSLQGVYGSAVTYSVQSGALPGGCSLNSSTGVVSGTATAGTTVCVIRATTTDAAGNAITADSSSQSITIT